MVATVAESRRRGGRRRRRPRTRLPRSGWTTRASRWWRGTPDRCGRWRRWSCGARGCRSRSSSGSAPPGLGDEIESLAGLPLDPYFSATKVRWLVESVPAVAEAAAAGALRVGTLDAYLCARLGSGPRTDPSTAARTQLQALAVARATGMRGCSSCTACRGSWLPRRRAVGRGAAVSCAGCRCGRCWSTRRRHWPATAASPTGWRRRRTAPGSSCSRTRARLPPADLRGLLPCVAWGDAAGVVYARDGGIFSAGTVISWLRDGLGAFGGAAESGPLAESVPDTGGVRFLPALAGLGAPWWRSDARAVISGVTSGTTRAHIVRAALDALAFRVRDVVDALPERPDVLRVDGGLTANAYLMQRQADVLGLPVLIAAPAGDDRPRRGGLRRRRRRAALDGRPGAADRRAVGWWSRVPRRPSTWPTRTTEAWRAFAEGAAAL